MALDNLLVKLGLNTKAYDAGLANAQNSARQFGSVLKSHLAGAFGTAAIVNFTRSLIDGIERIKDLSEQFNITTDDVQRFDFHARKNGLTMDAFSAGLARIAALRRAAAVGDPKAIETLNEFGISLKQATDPAFTMANAIDAVSDSINKLGLSAERKGILSDIFGRSGQRLISTLQEVKTPPPFKSSEEDVKAIDDASKAVSIWLSQQKTKIAKKLAVDVRGIQEKGLGGYLLDQIDWKRISNPFPVSHLIPTPPPKYNLQTGAGLTGPTFRNLDAEPVKINKGMDQKLGRLVTIEEDVRRAVQDIAIRGINPLGF